MSEGGGRVAVSPGLTPPGFTMSTKQKITVTTWWLFHKSPTLCRVAVCMCVLCVLCVPLQVTRARAQFFQRRVRLMLYSERAHFYHRYRIRGIQVCVWVWGWVGVFAGQLFGFWVQARRGLKVVTRWACTEQVVAVWGPAVDDVQGRAGSCFH